VARPLSALLIASNEICYNPRLLKAADCLIDRGVSVSVFSPVLGNAPDDVYADCVASRSWEVRGVDLTRRTLVSKATWARTAIASRAALAAWDRFCWSAGFHAAWNRSLLAFPWGGRAFDITVVNLVDNLPMAAAIARRSAGALLYDSQEYFAGEAGTRQDPRRARWVREAQTQFISDATVVTATTQVLADRLTAELRLASPAIRLRNAPLDPMPVRTRPERDAGPVRLVWHGFAVHLRGRGIDLLLEAVSRCRQPVQLTLQGRVSAAEGARIEQVCRELGIAGRVRFRPAAHPDRIVESLEGDDIGVIPEPGLDDNQRLTSSNKLFEYIHAGLAVIAPDLPGLAETVADEDTGVLYPAGNASALAAAIDRLAIDTEARHRLQRRAALVAPRLTWRQDFDAVWARLDAALDRTQASAQAPAMRRPA
jgi:glycosyltransferase involved in cell wall biosynthesis